MIYIVYLGNWYSNKVRKEFAENLDRLTDENSRMATELQNQVGYLLWIFKKYQEFWNFFQVVAHKAECLEKDLNLRGAKNDFEKNINQLHEKVQMTIEKKEKVRWLIWYVCLGKNFIWNSSMHLPKSWLLEMQVIEELQGQHEMALEKISQLESIITQQSVDMVSVEFEIKLIYITIS